MSEMVFRVASALVDALGKDEALTGAECIRMARAAIEAMREPSDDMCEAGAAYYHDNYQPGHAKEQTTAPDIWRSMIDEALRESVSASQK